MKLKVILASVFCLFLIAPNLTAQKKSLRNNDKIHSLKMSTKTSNQLKRSKFSSQIFGYRDSLFWVKAEYKAVYDKKNNAFIIAPKGEKVGYTLKNQEEVAPGVWFRCSGCTNCIAGQTRENGPWVCNNGCPEQGCIASVVVEGSVVSGYTRSSSDDLRSFK